MASNHKPTHAATGDRVPQQQTAQPCGAESAAVALPGGRRSFYSLRLSIGALSTETTMVLMLYQPNWYFFSLMPSPFPILLSSDVNFIDCIWDYSFPRLKTSSPGVRLEPKLKSQDEFCGTCRTGRACVVACLDEGRHRRLTTLVAGALPCGSAHPASAGSPSS